jgi:hypothetical protein
MKVVLCDLIVEWDFFLKSPYTVFFLYRVKDGRCLGPSFFDFNVQVEGNFKLSRGWVAEPTSAKRLAKHHVCDFKQYLKGNAQLKHVILQHIGNG